MVSKELFIKVMNDLQKEIEDKEKFDNAVKSFCNGEGSFFRVGLEQTLVDLLQELFHDKEDDWIGYFIYEKDWGRTYKTGDVTDNLGHEIPLRNIEDLYKILWDNYIEKEMDKDRE